MYIIWVSDNLTEVCWTKEKHGDPKS